MKGLLTLKQVPQARIRDTLKQLFSSKHLSTSFELAPSSKSCLSTQESGEFALQQQLDQLSSRRPLFIDFRWSADGGTQLQLSPWVQAKGYAEPLHITCAGLSKIGVAENVKMCYEQGCRNLLALRGDSLSKTAEPHSYDNARDLVEAIRQLPNGDEFCIIVAAHPQGHRCEASYPQSSVEFLKSKVDRGADLIMTQVVVDEEQYMQWYDRCRQGGINVPILPGLMVPASLGALQRMMALTNIRPPSTDLAEYEKLKGDPIAFQQHAVSVTSRIASRIIAGTGASHLHFFTMNRPQLALEVLDRI